MVGLSVAVETVLGEMEDVSSSSESCLSLLLSNEDEACSSLSLSSDTREVGSLDESSST